MSDSIWNSDSYCEITSDYVSEIQHYLISDYLQVIFRFYNWVNVRLGGFGMSENADSM